MSIQTICKMRKNTKKSGALNVDFFQWFSIRQFINRSEILGDSSGSSDDGDDDDDDDEDEEEAKKGYF